MKRNLALLVLIIAASAVAVNTDTGKPPIQREPSSTDPDSLDGEITVLHEDYFEAKKSITRTRFRDLRTGEIYELKNPLRNARTGDRVRLRGKFRNQSLEIENVEMLEQKPAREARAAAGNDQALILFVPVNFRNRQNDTTTSQLEASFNNVASYYRDFAGVIFTKRITNPVSIPFDSSACNPFEWASSANDILTRRGESPSSARNIVYVLPPSACSWTGLGMIGGGQSWINGARLSVLAHELGHNFGMGHASTLNSTGGLVEYGDGSDTMGSSGAGFNAPHREEMQWIDSSKIETLTENGIVTIDTLDKLNDSAPNRKILKIPYRNSSGANGTYFVSFRSRHDYGSQLSSTFSEKVNIHRFELQNSGRTVFLKALSDGQSFTENNITIKQLSHDSSSARVDIDLDAGDLCGKTPPLFGLTSTSVTTGPGQTFTIPAYIENKNPSRCPSSSYNVTFIFPGTNNPRTLTVAAGKKGSLYFTQKAPATDGFYTARFNFIGEGKTKTIDVPVKVGNPTGPCVRAAPTLNLNSTLNTIGSAGATLTLTIKSNDSASCTPIDYSIAILDEKAFTKDFNHERVISLSSAASKQVSIKITNGNRKARGSYSYQLRVRQHETKKKTFAQGTFVVP